MAASDSSTAYWACAVNGFARVIFSGLAVEAIGLVYHARDLQRNGAEGMASHYEQCTKFGMTYLFRNTGTPCRWHCWP